jgi:hypothetical protein
MKAPAPPILPAAFADFEELRFDLPLVGFGEAAPQPVSAPAAPRSPLGALAYRPALYRRNAVAWCSVRAWRTDAKRVDILRLKLCKRELDPSVITAAAAEISLQLRLLFGSLTGWLATSIACGHSRRPDCFGKQLGRAVAGELGLAFAEVFEDRFVAGVSHPKEFRNLPPLVWRAKPTSPTLVVDDLATSGMHIEEALGLIRGLGLASFGAVWIAGTVK